MKTRTSFQHSERKATLQEIRTAVKQLAEGNPNPDYHQRNDAYKMILRNKGDALYEILSYAASTPLEHGLTDLWAARLGLISTVFPKVIEDCPSLLMTLSESSLASIRYLVVCTLRVQQHPDTKLIERMAADDKSYIRLSARDLLSRIKHHNQGERKDP